MRSKALYKILGSCQYLDNILASDTNDRKSSTGAVFSFSKDQNDEFSFTQSVNQMHGIRSPESEPSSSVRHRKFGISSMLGTVDPEDGSSTEANQIENEKENARRMRELALKAVDQFDSVIDEYASYEDSLTTDVVERTIGMIKSKTGKPDRYTTVSQEEDSGSYEKEADEQSSLTQTVKPGFFGRIRSLFSSCTIL